MYTVVNELVMELLHLNNVRPDTPYKELNRILEDWNNSDIEKYDTQHII